jgi:hypothetical protein
LQSSKEKASSSQSPKGTKGVADMHKRAEFNGILVSLENLTTGKLERWVEENPQANPKEVKQAKKRIRLSREEDQE